MLLKLALLVTLGLSADVWTSFVNEEGAEYDATTGVEFSTFNTERGGNGGGPWADDCENKGGVKQITMECGRYAGSFQLRCKNNSLCPKRGAGLGNGHGATSTWDATGITKVLIRAGAYVDKVVFYKGNSAVKTCGSSNGGGAYWATAPAGMELCGLRGRSGWWTDKLAAGWCKHVPKSSGYIGCYNDKGARDLPKRAPGTYLPETCKKWCGDNKYQYAGVQWYGECWCGNSYGKYGKHEGCNTHCNKDKSQFCGGGWHNSIYRTHAKPPCPGHCMPKPAGPLNVASAPQKVDFNSHNAGDQIRKWFNGPALKGKGDKISGTVQYHDQGWGNKKTDVFLCCNCGASVQSGSNCVNLCGTNVRGSWKTCTFNKAVAGTCNKGSSTCVAYRVGGGGGHRFYGRNFNGKISHKDIADVLDIKFDGLFVSSVEIAEAQTGYVSHAAIGLGGLIFGIGAAIVMKRRQQVDYQSLV